MGKNVIKQASVLEFQYFTHLIIIDVSTSKFLVIMQKCELSEWPSLYIVYICAEMPNSQILLADT